MLLRRALLWTLIVLMATLGLGKAHAEGEDETTCEVVQGTTHNRFCITGTGSTVGYSFSITKVDKDGNEVGDPIASNQNAAAPGDGIDSNALATQLAAQLNAVLDPGGEPASGKAKVDKNNPNCVIITITAGVIDDSKDESFVLKVGTVGQDADMNVDREGANYNPFIFELSCPVTVPALSTNGQIVLSLLLVASAAVVLHWLQRTVG